MEVTEVKKRIPIKIDNTKHDDFLIVIVPDIVEFAKGYCNQTFVDDTGAEVLPGPVKTFVAKAAEYLMNPTGISSRSAPGTNYQYNMDFPTSILKLLRPYRKVRFV